MHDYGNQTNTHTHTPYICIYLDIWYLQQLILWGIWKLFMEAVLQNFSYVSHAITTCKTQSIDGTWSTNMHSHTTWQKQAHDKECIWCINICINDCKYWWLSVSSVCTLMFKILNCITAPSSGLYTLDCEDRWGTKLGYYGRTRVTQSTNNWPDERLHHSKTEQQTLKRPENTLQIKIMAWKKTFKQFNTIQGT